jgi:Uma2 family endonuclease
VLLVIEVADHSLRYDREIKLPLYARHVIPEVWLVDLLNNRINRFREGVADSYRQENEAVELDRVSPMNLPQVALDLSTLW